MEDLCWVRITIEWKISKLSLTRVHVGFMRIAWTTGDNLSDVFMFIDSD